MEYLINESMIRNYLGGASFTSGLICFASSSTYDKSFGKLGSGGLLVYVGISLSICYLIWGFKGIRVPERFQSVVETILSVAICFISVELDKLVPGKSDALGIVSYGLFALMSVSKSRSFELGFETGFFTFFLSLFLEQLFKTNWKLLPIGLVFGFATIFLRRRSQSGSPNDDRPQEVVPLINTTAPATDNHEYLDLEGQYPPEESSEATRHPPSNYGQVSEAIIEETGSPFSARYHLPSNYGQVSEENISDGSNEQNSEQEEDGTWSSLGAESSYSSEQDHVSSANYQKDWMQLLRRRGRKMRKMTPQ